MKIFIILSVLFIASCGKVDVSQGGNLGGTLSTSSQSIGVGSAEHDKIKSICDALAVKTTGLNALTNTQHTFTLARKGCSESSETTSSVVTTIVNQFSQYKFAEASGNLFYFSEVESTASGVMKDICANLNNLSSPIVTGSSYLYFDALHATGVDCPQVSGQTCIGFIQAVQEGSKARIHTKEWIRFRTVDQPKLGFFTYRKLISSASCVAGQSFSATANLNP